jgi:hypothetical protein
MIEYVERVRSYLKVDGFCDIESSIYGNIPLVERKSAKGIASQTPLPLLDRNDKGCRINDPASCGTGIWQVERRSGY